MTAITIERELLEQALVALSAPNHCVFSEPPICVDIRAALAAPAQPDQAFVCSLGCTTECLARQHGVPSECPSLPRQPVITPATAQAAEIARLRSESEERLQNCAALVVENEQLRKDAERYRWIRKTTNWVSSNGQRINVRDFPKSWDEHIDDAMKETP